MLSGRVPASKISTFLDTDQSDVKEEISASLEQRKTLKSRARRDVFLMPNAIRPNFCVSPLRDCEDNCPSGLCNCIEDYGDMICYRKQPPAY